MSVGRGWKYLYICPNVTEIYKVDDKGNRIEVDSYWGNKYSLKYKTLIKYNDKGLETENANYNGKGKPGYKLVSIYDDKGNETEHEFYICDSLKSKSTWTYDEKGNQLVGRTYKKDGTLESSRWNKYDDKSNLIESVTSGSSHKYYGNCYQNYDKEGNWLRDLYLADGKPGTITERVIEYY
jgi:hypothetical protein